MGDAYFFSFADMIEELSPKRTLHHEERPKIRHAFFIAFVLGVSTILTNLFSMGSTGGLKREDHIYPPPDGSVPTPYIRTHSTYSGPALDFNTTSTLNGLNEQSNIVTQSKSTQEAISPDFYIVGFPKCGTTTLLYAFQKHNDTAIPSHEFCTLEKKSYDLTKAVDEMKIALQEMRGSAKLKRGFKCPMGIRDGLGIQRLGKYSPKTKLIVGVRHPVRFFESFYNYRVTEMYNNN